MNATRRLISHALRLRLSKFVRMHALEAYALEIMYDASCDVRPCTSYD